LSNNDTEGAGLLVFSVTFSIYWLYRDFQALMAEECLDSNNQLTNEISR